MRKGMKRRNTMRKGMKRRNTRRNFKWGGAAVGAGGVVGDVVVGPFGGQGVIVEMPRDRNYIYKVKLKVTGGEVWVPGERLTFIKRQ